MTILQKPSQSPFQHNRAATEGGCSEGLEEHLKGESIIFGDIYEF